MKVTDTHVYFWGGYLSQWHKCKFTVDNITFSSAEQYMMYCKAKLFNDMDIANKILATDNQKEIKALGRQVQNFNQEKWDEVKYNIVLEGNMNKFNQDEGLLELLLSTDGLVLVEASPYDTIWGVGLAEDDPLILDENNWRGENLLGQALMTTRWLLGD